VEALKDLKDPLGMLGVKANAIIFHRKHPVRP
jgi:hypothetical protein